MDREAWWATVHIGSQRLDHDSVTQHIYTESGKWY